MIQLDDCGRELSLQFDYLSPVHQTDVIPSMIIKAPRGTIALFRQSPTMHYELRQCEAIKAFMEEHKFDGLNTTNIKTKEEANELASRMLRRHKDD